MEMLGKELIIGGFALMAFAQIVAAIIAFRVSFVDGMCSLAVPGYLLVAMRRVGHYWKFFGIWGAGVVAIIVGTVTLS
jgi:hypothetical protein